MFSFLFILHISFLVLCGPRFTRSLKRRRSSRENLTEKVPMAARHRPAGAMKEESPGSAHFQDMHGRHGQLALQHRPQGRERLARLAKSGFTGKERSGSASDDAIPGPAPTPPGFGVRQPSVAFRSRSRAAANAESALLSEAPKRDLELRRSSVEWSERRIRRAPVITGCCPGASAERCTLQRAHSCSTFFEPA